MDGGPGSDTLVGGAAGDLIGGPGDDGLDGNGGQATADYARDASPVTVDLVTGTATDGTGGHDTLTGIENVAGDAGADLTGDGNANVLTGNGAARTLGGGGDDIVQGAGGAIDGGAGTDTYRCIVDSDEVAVDLTTGSTDGCGAATLAGIENVTANTSCDMDTGCPVEIVGDGADNVLVVGACNCLATILAGGGADTLVGTYFVNGPRPGDTLDGGPGNDVLFGLYGDDRLVGGPGADTVFGGRGADQAFGLGGRDTIVGGWGADLIRGGRGADRLFGRRGPDALYGGFGNDRLNGGRGIDTCRGGPGTDTLGGCE
jgi:Ca2+-binding RTX toxin-like protein